MTALFVSTFLLLQLFCQVLVAVGSKCVLPPGYVESSEDNAAFKIYEIYVKWDEAEARCIADGGHLAVGTSLAKIQRINSTKPHTGRWAHGGIHRSATTGEWLRVDNGQPLPSKSIRWMHNAPSNSGLCTMISMYGAGSIFNFDCSIQKAHFACEIPLSEGRDGERGPVGPSGPKGAKGEPGMPGIPGRQGERGVNGFNGPQGLPGLPGLRGDDGRTGPVGPPGPSGPMGPIGLPSPAGKPGMKGEPGPPGPGYNATWLALLAACQEQSQGLDLIDRGESATGFENRIRVEQKCEEFIAIAYEQMWVSFQNFIEPEVRKESTEKTCRDLFVAHPEKPSGEYWIDPSVDGASDKILVHCDAETRSTCITPAINQSQVITYEGEDGEVWLSQLEMGMQITYPADSNQINALRLLSRHAEQKITYHCMQSVGYFDAEGETYDRGLKLSAWNGVELKPRGRQSLRYDVISDECQNRSDEWKKTVIAYRTDRPELLPIVDVSLRDLGNPEQQAIVGIGAVCFS